MDDSSQATRQRIVDAAFSLFLHHGFDGTGVNQILKKSNLSKGAFYHHFKSKDEIYNEVVSAFFLKPINEMDFDAFEKLPLREMREILKDKYALLPQNIKERSGIEMTQYFSLFFEALSRLPKFRQAVQTYYSKLIQALSARTYEEREVFPKVADAFANNVIATMEGRLLLNTILDDTILGDLPPPDEENQQDLP